MDTDKLVFGIIGGITLLITIVIIATSFSTSSTSDLRAQDLIGNNPHRKGPENARLTIVEFSDFECPYCAQYSQILGVLTSEYPNDLAVVYRHFPLPTHAGSVSAARASEAAANQGKFWEYHDELFANQPNFAQSDLEQYAQIVGLNTDQFKIDYASSDVINRVQEDADYGRVLNIRGTPTFYAIYDGKVETVNLQQYSDLETKIRSILGGPAGQTNSSTPLTPSAQSGKSDEGSSDGPTISTQIPADMPANIPMAVTLDIINVQRKDSVAPSEVSIVSVEKSTWPDASLGCGDQSGIYEQALTPGYKVIAEANGESFEYHANESAENVVFCGVISQ